MGRTSRFRGIWPGLALLSLLSARGIVAQSILAAPDVADGAELLLLTRRMSLAFGRGNLLEVARFYSDSAIIYRPKGAPVVGRAAIDGFWTTLQNPVAWKLEHVLVGGSRDQPHVLTRSTLVNWDAHGHQSVSRTMCLLIWHREPDGQLRIIVDMYTGSPHVSRIDYTRSKT